MVNLVSDIYANFQIPQGCELQGGKHGEFGVNLLCSNYFGKNTLIGVFTEKKCMQRDLPRWDEEIGEITFQGESKF